MPRIDNPIKLADFTDEEIIDICDGMETYYRLPGTELIDTYVLDKSIDNPYHFKIRHVKSHNTCASCPNSHAWSTLEHMMFTTEKLDMARMELKMLTWWRSKRKLEEIRSRIANIE